MLGSQILLLFWNSCQTHVHKQGLYTELAHKRYLFLHFFAINNDEHSINSFFHYLIQKQFLHSSNQILNFLHFISIETIVSIQVKGSHFFLSFFSFQNKFIQESLLFTFIARFAKELWKICVVFLKFLFIFWLICIYNGVHLVLFACFHLLYGV